MATYQHYSTALKSYYSLGLQDQFVTKSVRDLIPNSTAFGWKNHFTKEIIGKELNANFDKTKSEIQALYAPHAKVMRETTLAFSKFVTLLINSFEQKTFQKTMRAKKTDLINFLEEFSGIISYKTASSWMSISEKTLYSWRHRVKFKCDASPFLACVKRHPNQATLHEVQIIKEYLENEKYQHWGIHSIWALAFKIGITSLSCASFRLYNSFLKFRVNTKKGVKPKNSAPLRAAVINEIWHADITVFKTMDGVKHYIYTVMDNYSRYIHSWRIEKVVSAKIRLETITDAIASAFNGATFQDLHLVTDGGPENDNLTLKMFMKANQTSIKHSIALRDIVQSNSMMERFYYSSKYQCLYLKPILNLDHLTSTFTNWIEEYHTQKPHYAHGIYTPQEVLEGANLKICFKERIKNASKLRREVNKNANCIKKCVE